MQDGALLATLSSDHTARLWNVETRECAGVLASHTDSLQTGFLTPDGSRLLTSSRDCTAKLWDTATRHCVMSLEHKAPVEQVAASPDNQWALTCCAQSRSWLWNLRSGKCSGVLRVRYFCALPLWSLLLCCVVEPAQRQMLWRALGIDLLCLAFCALPLCARSSCCVLLCPPI